MHKRLAWFILLAMIITALACNYPGYQGEQTTEEPQIVLPSPTRTIAPLATATHTPQSDEPNTLPVEDEKNDCTYKSAFLDDITVPDDSEIKAGTVFTKTWRIHNNGTCPWETGTQLVFHSDADVGQVKAIDVPETQPDGVLNVSVTMTAPEEAGTYRSNWQLQTPDGEKYGSIYYVKFVVPGEAQPTPTSTPSGSAQPFGEFGGRTADDCSAVTFTWQDGSGESSYKLTGDDLDEILPANSNSYTWSNPATGTHSITLQALNTGNTEVDAMETTVVVDCGTDIANLKVMDVTYTPPEITAFLPISMTVRVKNVGDQDAGSFKVQWFDGTQANTEACSWWVTEGLPAGDNAYLTCTDYVYTGSYVDIVPQVAVDSTDLVKESNEDNNVFKQTIDVVPPVTAHNLIVLADSATWTIGPPATVIAFGDTGAGSASTSTQALENGLLTPEQCLLMQPQSQVNGWVQGTYDSLGTTGYTIQEGDVLYARAAFLEAATGAEVNFKVMLRLVDSGSHWIADVPHSYGEGIETVWVDLSPYAGKEAVIVLVVEGGGDTSNDLACWLDALIYRRPESE